MSEEEDYSAAVSHLILCGASSWVLYNTTFEDGPIMYSCYVYLLGHGLLGAFRNSQKTSYDENIKKIHEYSELVTTVLPLALFNTEYCLKHVEDPLIAYTHTALSITPLIVEPIEQDTVDNKRLIDLVLLGNIGSLAYLGYETEDCMATILAAFCAFHQFGVRTLSEHHDFHPDDLNAIALSIFCILSCKVRSVQIC